MNKIWKILKNSVLAGVILFSLLVIVSSVGFLGYKSYIVRTGSMSPNIKIGSIVLDKKASSYKVGDVITFKRSGFSDPVTHRIVNIKVDASNSPLYTVKGDANTVADSETVASSSIIGKVASSIPYIGYVNIFIKTLPGLVLCIIIPATVIIYSEMTNIGKEITLIRREKKKIVAATKRVEVALKNEEQKLTRKVNTASNKKRAAKIVMGVFLVMAGAVIVTSYNDSSIATLTDSVTTINNSVTADSWDNP